MTHSMEINHKKLTIIMKRKNKKTMKTASYSKLNSKKLFKGEEKNWKDREIDLMESRYRVKLMIISSMSLLKHINIEANLSNPKLSKKLKWMKLWKGIWIKMRKQLLFIIVIGKWDSKASKFKILFIHLGVIRKWIKLI